MTPSGLEFLCKKAHSILRLILNNVPRRGTRRGLSLSVDSGNRAQWRVGDLRGWSGPQAKTVLEWVARQPLALG